MKIIIERKDCNKIYINKKKDTIMVTAPHNTSIDKLRNHLVANKEWLISAENTSRIDNHVGRCLVDNFGDNIIARQLLEAYKVLLDGRIYSIVLGKKNSNDSEMVIGIENLIMSDIASRRKCIKSLIASRARVKLRERVSDVGNQLKLCVSNVKLEYMKDNNWLRRSNNQREIVLDYRLIQLPINLQYFIINVAFDVVYDCRCCKERYKRNFYRLIEQSDEYLFVKYLP